MTLQHAIKGAFIASFFFTQAIAHAAGYEKSILWSGKYAGQGNAAVSSVSGPEALYFNPAGLGGSRGTEMSVNFSPTFTRLSGPIASANGSFESKQGFSPIYGILAHYSLNDRLSLGVGSYVAAGVSTEFQNTEALPAPGATLKLSPKSYLSGIEYSVGMGYEILPGLKLGAAWRAMQVHAEVTTLNLGAITTEAQLTNLKDTRLNGYRVGLQYDAQDRSWGLGASLRSAIDFTAQGTLATKSMINTDVITNGTASVSSTLPLQVALGGHYQLTEAWKGALEYGWTQYSKVRSLEMTGTAAPGVSLNNISLNFKNQSVLRAGLSYRASENWTYRAGYSYTSQVTPNDRAKPTFTPPGTSHAFTLGIGTPLLAHVDLNLAGEYALSRGTGATPAIAGDYKASGYMLHTGLNYRF